MKSVILSLLAVLLLLAGCTTNIESVEENRKPVLVRTLTDISVKVNESILITLVHVEAYDDDGDEMKMLLEAGENYTLSGSRVIPTKGFIGDLYIPVTIYDGSLYSDQKLLIISVVNSVELMPLLPNSWWKYRDYVLANDSIFTSKLEIIGSSKQIIDAEEVVVYDLKWSNLEEYGLIYTMYTGAAGTVLLGSRSPFDTIVDPQQIYRYPIKMNDSWSYDNYKYNATDKRFFLGNTASMTCSDTLVYVTVPAGTFQCIEMTLTYSEKNMRNRSFSGTTVSFTSPVPYRAESSNRSVVEKLYYSPGVGYVKNSTTVNSVEVWRKELTSYYVEEKE